MELLSLDTKQEESSAIEWMAEQGILDMIEFLIVSPTDFLRHQL